MRIAINTLSITPFRGGVKTYLTNLVRHLAKVDCKNTYFIFVSPVNEALFQGLGENFKKILIPLRTDNRSLRVLCEQLLIPFYVHKYKINILFSPANLAILFPCCKQVTMIHDLHYRFIPKTLDRKRVWYYRLMLPISAWRSDRIIVPSQSTKRALLETVACDPERIHVIYEGVSLAQERKDRNMNESTLEFYNKCILFVSTLFPYKNADKLIQAYAKIANKITNHVVIIGRDPGGQITHLKKLASSLGVAKRVHFMGRADSIEPWYDAAVAFVYPSEQEGFGLPPLEAMAHGVPVIGSNRTSVPEVIGDAGLIVDPDDIEGLAMAIYQVVTDANLRERLIQKGYQRVQMFSWEKTARETLRVFKEVCQVERHA